jgi:hypothetical protein
MIQHIPVLKTLGGLFSRRDPQREATITLSRLLTQFDMQTLPFDRGVRESRRNDEARHVAIGIWLIPIPSNQSADDADMDKAIPAATCDLRRGGIGVLMPVELRTKRFVVAVADTEHVWRFFTAAVRHQSPRPGGWFQLGLHVEQNWDPDAFQTLAFRHRVENAFKE